MIRLVTVTVKECETSQCHGFSLSSSVIERENKLIGGSRWGGVEGWTGGAVTVIGVAT